MGFFSRRDVGRRAAGETSVRFAIVCAGALVASCGRVGYDLLPIHGSAPNGSGGTVAGEEDGSAPPTVGGAAGAGSGGAPGGAGGASGANAGGTVASGGTSDAPDLDASLDATGSGGAPNEAAVPDANPCTIPVEVVADYCAEVPALKAAPVIDGVLDCGLALHPFVPEGWSMTTPADASNTTPDATAEYAIAWRPDGLYMYVLVQDPNLLPAEPTDPTFFGDGAELYVDDDGTYEASPLYDNPGTRQFTTVAPTATEASAARGEIWYYGSNGTSTPWTSTEFRAFPRPGGYALEAFVVAADLSLSSWTLSAGKNVGFNLAVNVSFGSASATGNFGHRLGQYFLRLGDAVVDGGSVGVFPFVNTTAFCNPTLLSN